MSEYYNLLTSIIACSKIEQAIMLLRTSPIFSSSNIQISEKREDAHFSSEQQNSEFLIESKYFQILTISSNSELTNTDVEFLTSVLQVLDDKKDASSETLQKKRSKQELDIFTIFAHEFRTPLTVIQSSVELLVEFFPEWDTQKITEFLRSIQQQTTSISTLLEMIAELYDARSNTQEIVDLIPKNYEEFFEQIHSILSKRFHFQFTIESNTDTDFLIKIPIRALMYVLSVALQSFEAKNHHTNVTVSKSHENGLLMTIYSSNTSFSETEINLLQSLFSENIIEDVSGEWLPYLLASICSQYLNATISVGNTTDNTAYFKLSL